jgi:glycosyl transferase family 9 (putative heptosyltransferase)
VLRALGLGDLLTAVPALRGVAAGLPGRRLLLVAPRALAPLVALMGREGRRFELTGADGLRGLPAAAHGAQLAVNLHGRGPQSHRLLLAGGARRLLAFAHPEVGASAGGPHWRAEEHEVTRWCRLVRTAGLPADPARLALRSPPGADDGPLAGATVVHPGAASEARRWPAARFAALACVERCAGRRVVITGSAAERGLAAAVAAAADLDDDAVLAGRTTLAELAGIVAGAGRVVCGDTGVAHLATAFGTPSVVLFGPTPPAQWGPPAVARSRHRVLWTGRLGDPHAGGVDAGLLAISVGMARAELDALDGERRRATPDVSVSAR